MIYMTDLTLMQRGSTAIGGTYSTIPQCTNIKPPTRTRKKAEVYTHDQSAPETKYGAEEAMTVEFDLAFDDGNVTHQQLYTDYVARTEWAYQIVYPSGRIEAFIATIEAIAPGDQGAEGSDPQTAKITLGLAAAPTITW